MKDTALIGDSGDSGDGSRVERYFDALVSRYGEWESNSSICITHLLPPTVPFLVALARLTSLACVLPKPKSLNRAVADHTRQLFNCATLNRELFADPNRALAFLEQRVANEPVFLIDVGGYFSPSLGQLAEGFSGRLLGVVEDTENGLQKYERLSSVSCPVYSVARSPLKNAEDYLVGVSIVFSTEAVLRSRGDILEGRLACVIGYGKVGRSVAAQLHARRVSTTVCDTNPIRMTEAIAHGFRVEQDVRTAVNGAGLVVCATGNRALGASDFNALANGAYIASVTSSDDELGLGDLQGEYGRSWVGENVHRYRSNDDHYFYVLNEGNAVNFLHGATLGPAIHLVQGEILAAVGALARGEHDGPGLAELSEEERGAIAEIWLEHFS